MFFGEWQVAENGGCARKGSRENMQTMKDDSSKKAQRRGQAVIALASAAGVIAATRMSRTGLLLTAGLVWHLWRQAERQPRMVESAGGGTQARIAVGDEAMPSWMAEMEKVPPVADFAATPMPVAVSDVSDRPKFPEAPGREEEATDVAWTELRAALLPLSAAVEQDAESSDLAEKPAP